MMEHSRETSDLHVHCRKLVTRFQIDLVLQRDFKHAETNIQRIKVMYPLSMATFSKLEGTPPKKIASAERLKVEANKLYQIRQYNAAIGQYNEALTQCPQDTDEGRTLYDVLIANRTAALFALGMFEEVLTDIDFLNQSDNHPMPHKFLVRGATCLMKLGRFSMAKVYLAHAIAAVEKNHNISHDLKVNLEKEIQDKLSELGDKDYEDQEEQTSHVTENYLNSRSTDFPNLISDISIRFDPLILGRYATAADNIRTGSIIGAEDPFVSVLHYDHQLTNCSYCLKSTNQPHSCPNCMRAIFCSIQCRTEAQKTYHKFECCLMETLTVASVSVNCLMALRMITQSTLKGSLLQNFVLPIYKLESHSNKRDMESYFSLTLIACYLLILLKQTDFFLCKQQQILNEDEALIGALMLTNLEILQFNAHEISELENTSDGSYKAVSIGSGLYPTLALFNHSCDPSVIRYTVGTKMILRTIKPITKGEIIYENYGPLYTVNKLYERRQTLNELYWFDCCCIACSEDWALLEDLDNDNLRIRCSCNGIYLASRKIEFPVLVCSNCKKATNVLPFLQKLLPLDAKAKQIDCLLEYGRYKNAENSIIEVIEIYDKYLKPPYTDLAIMQQKLKICYVHAGNRKHDYRILNLSI